MEILYMKQLVPEGKGGYYVTRVECDTQETMQADHDRLQAMGWADATSDEYENFLSAAPAVGEILGDTVRYAPIGRLSEEQQKQIDEWLAALPPEI